LSDLHDFLKQLALSLGGRKQPKANHFAKLIEKTKGRDDAVLIQTMLLRSMGLAIYSPENKGHFGLAYDTYTHFTSPIRRYPDLLVHRAIRHCLQGQPVEKFPYPMDKLSSLAEHCSMAERRADEATRDAMNWLKCDYMQDKVGQKYNGLITGVTPFGIFVMLDNLSVEGLVHVTALKNDYYHFDPVGQCLYGEYSNTVYRLSDRLQVKVVRVDVEEKKIDFEIA
jgi:ribonuclease R